MSLSVRQLSAVRVQLGEIRLKAEGYFQAVEGSIFRTLVYTPTQADIKKRADQAKSDYQVSLVAVDNVISGSSYQGHVPTAREIGDLVRQMQGALDRYNAAVLEWNAASPVGVLTGTVGTLFTETQGLLTSLLKGIGESGRTVAGWIRWVPWIVVGAFVVPVALRAWSKKRREGTEAALDYTAESIEGGRANVGRGAGIVARRAAGLPF